MRHVLTAPRRHAALAVVVLSLVLVAVSVVAALAGGAAAGGLPVLGASGSPSPEPSVSPSPSPSPGTGTCVLSRPRITYGASVTVSGLVTPAAPGVQVVVSAGGVDKATVLTDETGAYQAVLDPRRSTTVVARVAGGAESPAVPIQVVPAVTLSHGTPIPFLACTYTLKVAPAAYDGVVVAAVHHRGELVARVSGRVRDGRVSLRLPLRGIEWFGIAISLPAAQGLDGRSIDTSVKAVPKTLRVGSTGLRVKGMLTAFKRLRIRVPGTGTSFTTKVKDSVMAFQKAYRLPRTYVMDYDDWRRLDGAAVQKPRFTSPATHLEVDKTRQILMVVRDGKLLGLICISSGKTGNTPEGSFRILRKTPATTSLYGPDVLYRTMGFYKNFAIHGYPSVPPYPASHGCVREPVWVADWVYDRSFVGERLYIYR
jgi:hypothetical protein